MASYEYVDYGSPDGVIVGTTSTKKIGFYGTVPVSRLTISTAISTTASISTAGLYGFSTSTEALQVVNAVSTIAYALTQLGIVA